MARKAILSQFENDSFELIDSEQVGDQKRNECGICL